MQPDVTMHLSFSATHSFYHFFLSKSVIAMFSIILYKLEGTILRHPTRNQLKLASRLNYLRAVYFKRMDKYSRNRSDCSCPVSVHA